MPDFTFWDWPETGIDASKLEKDLFRIGSLEFAQRTNYNVLWRGAAGGGSPGLRSKLPQVKVLLEAHNLSDIEYVTYPLHLDPKSLTIQNACNNRRYLLHSEGMYGRYSSRLKWLLMCGAVVFIPKLEYEDSFFKALKDGVTHIEISNDCRGQ